MNNYKAVSFFNSRVRICFKMTNYRDLIESLVYCDEERHSRRAVKLIQQNPRKIEELLSKGFCINCRWFRQCNCSTVSIDSEQKSFVSKLPTKTFRSFTYPGDVVLIMFYCVFEFVKNLKTLTIGAG